MKNRYSSFIFFIAILLVSAFSSSAQTIPSNAHMAIENEYDVNFYWLDLKIEDTSTSISGNVLIRGYALTVLDTFGVELDTLLTIDSAVADLGGGAFQAASVLRSGIEVNIFLPFSVPTGQYTEVRIYYHGKPKASSGFPTSGFFTGPNQKFSASPPYNSYTWWPCKQVLTDKADSSWFYITTDTSSRGISNGVLNHVTSISPTLNRWEWRSHHPIAFYLVSFVAGKYPETTQYFHPRGRTDSMQIQYYNYTPPTDTLIPSILQVYTNLFGPYPFYDEKFGIAKTTLSGGMENQTIVSLGIGGVEAHETSHQWFGDNVTCGSWQDIMINEGFARWCESVYPEFSGGGDSARISVCNDYETSVLSFPQGSGYSPADTQTVIGVFGNEYLYYDKNAMMLNSLRFTINNDSIFFLGLRNYQAIYHGSNAYGNNLRDVMENTTGIDLTDFFNQLYYGFGFPTYNITWHQVANELMLQITQTTSSTNTPLFTTPLQLKVLTATGDTTVRLNIGSNITTFNIPISGSADSFVVDPNQWIANGQGTVQMDTSLFVSGIHEIRAASNYKVYPNPASTYLDITSGTSSHGAVDMILYNDLGQKVYNIKTLPNGRISLPALSDGLYTLQIDHTETFKVIVAK
jgi:aminopeptidase N